jgi:hypothetical protein
MTTVEEARIREKDKPLSEIPKDRCLRWIAGLPPLQ